MGKHRKTGENLGKLGETRENKENRGNIGKWRETGENKNRRKTEKQEESYKYKR